MYEPVIQYFLSIGEIVTLGNRENRVCRFCGKTRPEVSFRKDAHAFPEAIGNKSLFTYYECDVCNDLFGGGIEDHFGKWTAPQRTISQVYGKQGVPTIKIDENRRIELVEDGFVIKQYFEDQIVEIDETEKTLRLSIPRQTYIPLAVFKTFTKMALSIMPDSEVAHFQPTIDWVKNTDHTAAFMHSSLTVHDTFVPGPRPFKEIAAMLFRRKSDSESMPYMTFVVAYGNNSYQIFVPCPEKDKHLQGQFSLFYFPTPYDITPSKYGMSKKIIHDMSGHEPVRGESTELALHFNKIEEK